MRVKRTESVYGLVLALCLSGASLFGQGNSENVRNLNGRVLQLQASLKRANGNEHARIQSEAAPVFSQRAAALTALIKENPGAALGLAFSQDLLDELSSDFP